MASDTLIVQFQNKDRVQLGDRSDTLFISYLSFSDYSYLVLEYTSFQLIYNHSMPSLLLLSV
ncbi:MAG: hypothetical protein LHW49_09205 [Candidatus Cloacimonetes bacterium]|nr:hypothetical protein [Candidatus Cloacimonadota bacterium]